MGKRKIKKKWDQAYLRIMDANFNRAKEAVRVAEDFARFLLNDKPIAGLLKKCRHDLTAALLKFSIPYRSLLQSRDSARDVGRAAWIQDGSKKPGWQELMIANLKRSQEALRVLEELSKAISPSQTKSFQAIRFRLYEIEKKAVLRP